MKLEVRATSERLVRIHSMAHTEARVALGNHRLRAYNRERLRTTYWPRKHNMICHSGSCTVQLHVRSKQSLA